MDIITHSTSPYSEDHIYKMAMVGREPEFWVNRRGLGNLRQRYSKVVNKNQAALDRFRERAMKSEWHKSALEKSF